MNSNFRTIQEDAVNKQRFKIDDCIAFESYLDDCTKLACQKIKARLTSKEYKAFRRAIIRNSFLIEPVNNYISSTKVKTHWTEQLEGDVRFADFQTCAQILQKIIFSIEKLSDEDFNALKYFFNYTVISYEIPVDYISRFANPIHTPTNIALYLDNKVKACISMRKFIMNEEENPASNVFQRILADKVKVKTYLTDRALTGDYKTNREKRWEAHPNSVQYSLRRNCMEIETKLMAQIAMFEGCDQAVVQHMQRLHLLPNNFAYCRCPITGDNLQYIEFAREALHPIHGKSKFQVGHLNPLKASDLPGAHGHTADNISWISEDGNRIQGSLSLMEVDNLLRRIYRNRPELRQ